MEKKLLTVEEMAHYIGSTPNSVYSFAQRGRIPKECIRRVGRSLRFDVQAVAAWIDKKAPGAG